VRGRDDHTVGEARRASPVVGQDGVRDRRCGGVAVRCVDEHGDVVGREHLQCGDPGRLGQGVRVRAEEERAVGALLRPVLAYGLTGGGDVVLVEGRRQRRPAVSRRAERHALPRVRRVGVQRVVRRHQPGHIDQVTGSGRLARCLVLHGSHSSASTRASARDLIFPPPATPATPRHPARTRAADALTPGRCSPSVRPPGRGSARRSMPAAP
jgi:hypothetical protein